MWFKCRSLDFPARVLILGSPESSSQARMREAWHRMANQGLTPAFPAPRAAQAGQRLTRASTFGRSRSSGGSIGVPI